MFPLARGKNTNRYTCVSIEGPQKNILRQRLPYEPKPPGYHSYKA